MADYMNRILRAAKLDANLYEEVEADTGAMRQAMGVVMLASLAAGIGSAAQVGMSGLLMGTLSALAGWYIWAFLIYLIGAKLLPQPQTRATHGELLRTLGFAAAPGMLRILGVIPPLTGIVFLIASFWMLAAMIVAVRQALDYDNTMRAVGVCVLGWIVQLALIMMLFFLLGSPDQAGGG
jgi:hypothetical protein